MRNEPLRSEPSSSDTNPAASAAALPPDEPPGVRLTSHGLLVVPYTGFELCQSASCIARFVLPRMIAPAASRRETTTAFSRTGIVCVPGIPHVVASPATLKHSFTVIG